MSRDRPSSPMHQSLCLTVESDPLAVRTALSRLMQGLTARGVSPQALAMVELVLAEVLNNVVEHAYARGTGPIDIRLTVNKDQIDCRVCDRGRTMPGNTLPQPARVSLDGPVEDLPEGGFGWTLIHKLAKDISYTRTDGENRLEFGIPLEVAAR